MDQSAPLPRRRVIISCGRSIRKTLRCQPEVRKAAKRRCEPGQPYRSSGDQPGSPEMPDGQHNGTAHETFGTSIAAIEQIDAGLRQQRRIIRLQLAGAYGDGNCLRTCLARDRYARPRGARPRIQQLSREMRHHLVGEYLRIFGE